MLYTVIRLVICLSKSCRFMKLILKVFVVSIGAMDAKFVNVYINEYYDNF